MENKEDKNEMEPCRRCRKMFHYTSLRIDDDYLEEPVCGHCCGCRKCERCSKTFQLHRLVLDKDNYFVCLHCEDRELNPCCRCRGLFFEYELNYVLKGNYACDTCEEIIEKSREDIDYISD